ncbi:UNKNOWN [Stylonychia lemnae]|uniref:Uncharacterized protein n=1 Tax=Stylonychia lemnae TaxID=5949 RepID=A0A078A9I0_STYLE|nr:UNKNOWN [Stylonychia lemnae]|eukprot:CDW78869.1 UNKNOWN [Stylonychia lemnae]
MVRLTKEYNNGLRSPVSQSGSNFEGINKFDLIYKLEMKSTRRNTRGMTELRKHETTIENKLDSSQHKNSVFNESVGQQLSQMMKGTYQIIIGMNQYHLQKLGNKKVNFDIYDEIFHLLRPNTSTISSTSCFSCDKDLTKNKSVQYCSRGQIGTADQKGKICKICDRKFILYDTYAEYAYEIEQKDILIKDEAEILDQKALEFEESKQQLQLMRNEVIEKEKIIQDSDYQTNRELETLDNNIDNIQQQLDKIKLKYSTKQFDQKAINSQYIVEKEEVNRLERVLYQEKQMFEMKIIEFQNNEQRYQTMMVAIDKKKTQNQNNSKDESRVTHKGAIEGRALQSHSYINQNSQDQQKPQMSLSPIRKPQSGDIYNADDKVLGQAQGAVNNQASYQTFDSNGLIRTSDRSQQLNKKAGSRISRMESSKGCCAPQVDWRLESHQKQRRNLRQKLARTEGVSYSYNDMRVPQLSYREYLLRRDYVQLELSTPQGQQLLFKLKMMLKCAIEGDLDGIIQICEAHQVENIVRVTGELREVKLLGQQTTTDDWNPMHLAIYYKHLPIVKYFLETLQLNPRLTLLGPLELDQTKNQEEIVVKTSIEALVPFPSLQVLCYSLVLAINNKDYNMLNYLLNQFSQDGKFVSYPIWNSEQLSYVLTGVIAEKWIEGIDVVLKGNCSQHIYLNMDYHQRTDFIGERIARHLTEKLDKAAKFKILSNLAEFPYAGLSIGFLVDDLDCSQILLETALDNISIDDLELMYIYELEEMPKLIIKLKARGVSKELVKRVFSYEDKDLKDKASLKQKFLEFIDLCIEGDLAKVKYFVRSQELLSVNYYYSLQKKSIRFLFRQEPPDTKYFTPLIYCIFYDKPKVLEYLIQKDLINGYSGLKEPPYTFSENEDEELDELGVADDEWFQSSSSEIFCLEILISTRNFWLFDYVINKFQHQWCFTHFCMILEHTIQRMDEETLTQLFKNKVFNEAFDVLRYQDQFNVLHYFTTKSIEYISLDIKNQSKYERRINIAMSLLDLLSQRPFCPQYIFILIAMEDEIKNVFCAEGEKFFNSIFKKAYRNTTDEDVEILIKVKKDEILEITSAEFKAENKDNALVLAVIKRIESKLIQ